MLHLGRHLNAAVREQIRGSAVRGVTYLGQPCRAFGDARGGIASIVAKAEGVTEREAEKLLEKRAAVVDRIEHGAHYLQEAVAFFERDNLRLFRHWLLDHQGLHDIKAIEIKKEITLTRQLGVDWLGNPRIARFDVPIPDLKAPDLADIKRVLGW